MVRNRKRKSETHGQTPGETMKEGVRFVLGGKGLRKAAKELNISKSTLGRYVALAKTHGFDSVNYEAGYSTRQIFTDTEEAELSDYLITAAKLHHGLTTVATRLLAYEYAVKNNKTVPETWMQNKMAGTEWLYCFLKRHKNLAIRKPEATSLSRGTSFNRKNVGDFFDNLETVMERFRFKPESIYNADETALMTVHKPPKIIAERGAKQVGQVTSAERGQHVTLCGAVNAVGNSVPPFLIFPRVHFKEHMLKGSPPGSRGTAHNTGWMTVETFNLWLDHFIEHSHSSMDNQVLLLLDNHESHVSLQIIEKAKSNGIILLTFPPHCSHKLQPLDRTVYGPLKRYYNAAADAWQLHNPGTTMTIYDVAEVLGTAYPRSFTNQNIIAGFRVTGIFPFDRNIFRDDEFLPSFVTDRENETVPDAPRYESSTEEATYDVGIQQQMNQETSQNERQPPQLVKSSENIDPNNGTEKQHKILDKNGTDISGGRKESIASTKSTVGTVESPLTGQAPSRQAVGNAIPTSPVPGTSETKAVTPTESQGMSSLSDTSYFSPEDVRPYPKAKPRKRLYSRKKCKTLIMTDTPVKKQLEEEYKNKGKKSKPKMSKTLSRNKKVRKLKKQTESENDSTSDDSDINETVPSTDTDIEYSDTEFDKTDADILNFQTKDLQKGKYVLVKYPTKTAFKYFVGQVKQFNHEAKTYSVSYLVRQPTKTKTSQFIFPEREDLDDISFDCVVAKLPEPAPTGGTSRAAKQLRFNVDLSSYF